MDQKLTRYGSLILLLALLLPLPSGAAESCSETCEWGYGPADGPPNWGALCCPVCEGASQSPIDLLPAMAVPAGPGPLAVNYRESHLELFNNGHTIEATHELADEENFLTISERRYDLTQFHFHSLSEHTVEGRHSPLEMHMVHERASYDLAVIAVMIEEGAENAAFAPMWNSLPVDVSVDPRTVIVNLKKLLPANLGYHTYVGSLTTPNCSEIVTWFVLNDPIRMSMAQIESFRAIFDGNYRPVQPLNGRVVGKDGR